MLFALSLIVAADKLYLRWPEPFYIRVGDVFDLRFSE